MAEFGTIVLTEYLTCENLILIGALHLKHTVKGFIAPNQVEVGCKVLTSCNFLKDANALFQTIKCFDNTTLISLLVLADFIWII